jgi:hypothetical protein
VRWVGTRVERRIKALDAAERLEHSGVRGAITRGTWPQLRGGRRAYEKAALR